MHTASGPFGVRVNYLASRVGRPDSFGFKAGLFPLVSDSELQPVREPELRSLPYF